MRQNTEAGGACGMEGEVGKLGGQPAETKDENSIGGKALGLVQAKISFIS